MIPVLKEQAILNCWKSINKGVEELLNFTDYSEIDLFNAIMARECLLWIVFNDKGEYVGFTVTRIEVSKNTIEEGEVRSILIVGQYLVKGCDKEIVLDVVNNLLEYVKTSGSKSLRFYTSRAEAFERRLGEGWRRGMVEFIREV